MMIPKTTPPAKNTIKDLDQSNAIKIASCIILSVTVVIFVARQAMKAVVIRRAALDDLFILSSFVFAVGLSFTTFLLASKGLGSTASLSVAQADNLMKGCYASEFLYISAISFAKLSVLVLFYNIVSVQRWHRRFVIGCGTFIVAWCVASLAAVAFQCKLPRPWNTLPLHCFDTRTFWIVYCIIDMSTEVITVALSVNIVAYLRIRFSRKVSVVACFAPRVLVLGAALVRLIWLYPVTPHSVPQYRLWVPTIISQVHVCLGIATASIPYMVPFFKGLDGNLRRTPSTRSRVHLIDEEAGRSRSSLWFRRHNKSKKVLDLWDPEAEASSQYERVPQASPRVPTPRPMTPMSAFRVRTPPSRQASVRGLNIYVPYRDPRRQRSLDWASPASPRTESSGALSPTCASPQALLLQSFTPSRKAPSPPPKIHSPKPPTPSSCCPSRGPTPPASTPHAQRFSLFPSKRSPSVSPPQPRQNSSPSPCVPPIRAMRSQTISGTSRYPVGLSPQSPPNHVRFPVRSSSRAQHPKFSTITYLQTPPLPTAMSGTGVRPGSVQDLTSPMGAAMNSWFSTSESDDSPQSPAFPLPSLQQSRNHQALSPVNSIRVPNSRYTNHARSPTIDDVLRDERHLPRGSIGAARNSRSQTLPSVRDVRHSPHIVVRSPS